MFRWGAKDSSFSFLPAVGVSCLCRVTATAWAITRQGLPIAHDGRQRLSDTAARRIVRLSTPSVGSRELRNLGISPSVGVLQLSPSVGSPSVGAVAALQLALGALSLLCSSLSLLVLLLMTAAACC